jgi:hypothetical protein
MTSRRTLSDFRQKLAQLFEDPDALPPEELNQWRASAQSPPPDPDIGCLDHPTIEPSCLTFKSPHKPRESHPSILAQLFRRSIPKTET